MSVLNQSGEEQVECPLCMEPLEVDDLNFYPCTCGYQICRFCWHRIRTDENGLCPACRKAYSENPADFTPLSKEQVAQLKAEKRQRDQQRKAKQSESRKHLASVRVVQRNLVFVVGLPMRLADPEILKRHEYFGKFGKIHKVVINQSTAYAGSQGPSASAYVTYMKSDDALRAIQSVNNIPLDGRHIKSSLGTTKYCSHFMKNQPCPKPDCMYLHDFGDPEASFTKEQMHAGKHQEYEKKLHEALQSRMAQAKAEQSEKRMNEGGNSSSGKCKESTVNGSSNNNVSVNHSHHSSNNSSISTNNNNNSNVNSGNSQNGSSTKESWPQLNDKKDEKKDCKSTVDSKKVCSTSNGSNNNRNNKINKNVSNVGGKKDNKSLSPTHQQKELVNINDIERDHILEMENHKPQPVLDDNSSFFSHQNSYQKIIPEHTQSDELETSFTSHILNDSFPDINSAEDWEAAFGFSKHSNHLEELAQQKSFNKVDSYFFGNLNLPQAENVLNHEGYDFKKDSLLGKMNTAGTNSNQHTIPANPMNDRLNGTTQLNGLNNVEQMSKFFSDFSKNTKDLNGYFPIAHNGMNGYAQHHSNATTNLINTLTDKHMMLMQQKQLEEQLVMLNLKQQSQQQLLHNASHYMNGDIISSNNQRFCTFQNQFNTTNRTAPTSALNLGKQQSLRSEDDLDFDPFQETQKGLAELIESDQSLKLHMSANSNGPTSQINGLLHSQSGNSMLPPPPPGFVQPHMNSFGSKILPYLNMNSQQQLNTSQNNWPSSYNNVLHQQPQHKGMGACNDWKVLDPAIVSSSSRYFSLANVPTLRGNDQYAPIGQMSSAAGAAPSQVQQNGPMRAPAYDFPNGPSPQSTFSNLSQLPQPQGYNFAHLNAAAAAQQNLHWLGADLGAQISTPPGFRSQGQTTKQQEC